MKIVFTLLGEIGITVRNDRTPVLSLIVSFVVSEWVYSL